MTNPRDPVVPSQVMCSTLLGATRHHGGGDPDPARSTGFPWIRVCNPERLRYVCWKCEVTHNHPESSTLVHTRFFFLGA